MKINISLDDDLVARIDNYADNNYMSRSGLISLACSQFLNSNEVILAIKEISLCIKKISDNGSLDAESLEKLEDFERFAKMITNF